jgi:hypothetical protein
MNVTRPQVIDLKSRLWPAACAARGWDVKDRDWQMQMLSEIIGRRIESSTEIEKLDEFTQVKAQLEAWANGTNLKRVVRTLNNPRRVLETKIMIEQVKLLSVVMTAARRASDVQADIESAQTYVATLMARRFRTQDISQISDRPDPTRTDEKSDLELLRDTLDARIGALRNERVAATAGLSVEAYERLTIAGQRRISFESGWNWHDVKTAAGVECDCRTICQGTRAPATAAAPRKEEVGA